MSIALRPVDHQAMYHLADSLFKIAGPEPRIGSALRAARNISTLAASEYELASTWETPEWLVSLVHGSLGSIDLDPCTTAQNPARAQRFYCPPTDGYHQSWDASTIYMNPPYGKTIGLWSDRLITETERGTRAIALVPARTDVAWFHKLCAAAQSMLMFRGRIKFRNPLTGDANSTGMFPSIAFGLNVSLDGWADHGKLVRLK